MEKRRLGNTDIEVSTISLGCWPMGGWYWGKADDDESIHTVHKALELGINFFDNAPGYGSGHAEEILGKALKGRREEAIIGTKASAGVSPDKLQPQLEDSLKRLQTDYIDVYYVHWPQRSEPLSRTMELFEGFRREGKIRAIGVSNFTVKMLEMASKYGTVDALQPPYNLIWRFIEEDVLPYCREHNIGIVTYSSLAQGILTGTIRLNTHYAEEDKRPGSILWRPENFGKCLYTAERLRAVAKELGVSVAQLALRWLVSQQGVTSTLVGARTISEIVENAGALDFELPKEVLAQVQEISDEIYHLMPYYYDMWGNWTRPNMRGTQREVLN